MKVVVLSDADISDWIAAALVTRGHEVTFVTGGVHEAALDALDFYDGCLLLGEAPEFAAIASLLGRQGKPIWTEWPDIPLARA